jgi:hypothetical protein
VNASPTQNVARAARIMLVVILAAAAGLAAGNALQQVREEASITAQASFSRAALDDLNAIRDDRPAAAAAYPDYAIRHAPTNAAASDWALRHRMLPAATTTTYRLTGPSDVEAPSATTTDTFRLTGPSDLGTELRGQRRAN